MAKPEQRSRLQDLLNRLEPWLIFLSILAILFVPVGKGYYWLVLLAVACVNLVRRWREAWQWVSLDSMGNLVTGIAWAPLIVFLYLFLHGVAPGLVHTLPSFDAVPGVYDLEPTSADGPTGWRAEVTADGPRYRVVIRRPAADADQVVLSAAFASNRLAHAVVVPRENEVLLEHARVSVADFDLSKPDAELEASLRVSPDAHLTHLVLRGPDKTIEFELKRRDT